MEKGTISYKAIRCTQNDQTFYLTVIDSMTLKKMCYVSRRSKDSKAGFQRLLSTSRAENIRDYLDNGKGVIPTAVILSAQNNAGFIYDETNNTITLSEERNSMLVIDGQHRLYGMFKSDINYEVPVVIFADLDLSNEVKLFIDINTTQKGVPSALLLDIKDLTGRESSVEARQRRLFENMDRDSVLSGYLLPNSSATGKISRTVFNTSTKSIFESSFFKDQDDQVVYQTLKNYLAAMNAVFGKSGNDDAKLNKSVFFRASLNIFVDSCEKVIEQYNNLKIDSFIQYLIPISDMNFSVYTGSNNATVSKATNEMKSLLKPRININEDMF